MWCLHMLLVDSSMEPAALLACVHPPLLPFLYASYGLTVHDDRCRDVDMDAVRHQTAAVFIDAHVPAGSCRRY
jgi:hypothetical protein